jgi:DNA-binding MarR family transcriptional regulator
MDDRTQHIRQLLTCSGQLFRTLHATQDSAWLTIELTMPQFKALLCVAETARATSTQVARALGVSLSTVTGIVDRLAEQGLVVRREDSEDRRITRVLPTPRGQELVDELLRYRDELLNDVLSRLDDAQLELVTQAFELLLEAAKQVAEARQSQEVVA